MWKISSHSILLPNILIILAFPNNNKAEDQLNQSHLKKVTNVKFTSPAVVQTNKMLSLKQIKKSNSIKSIALNTMLTTGIMKNNINKFINKIKMKPIKGRMLYEVAKFLPLNRLIECRKANWILQELAIRRARNAHQNLIYLYYYEISIMAIWFKQWALQVAEVRAKIYRSLDSLKILIQIWSKLNSREMINAAGRFLQEISLLSDYSIHFCDLVIQLLLKFNQILNLKADRYNIIAKFNFPSAIEKELCQMRIYYINKAIEPIEFELDNWVMENISKWFDFRIIIDGLMNVYRTNFYGRRHAHFSEEFSWIKIFFSLSDKAKSCLNQLKMAANHMIRLS